MGLDLSAQLQEITKGEEFEVTKRSVYVKSLNSKGKTKRHDVSEFGQETNLHVLELIQAARIQFPRHDVSVIVEIKTDFKIPKPPKAKAKAKTIIVAASSPLPSSPPEDAVTYLLTF